MIRFKRKFLILLYCNKCSIQYNRHLAISFPIYHFHFFKCNLKHDQFLFSISIFELALVVLLCYSFLETPHRLTRTRIVLKANQRPYTCIYAWGFVFAWRSSWCVHAVRFGCGGRKGRNEGSFFDPLKSHIVPCLHLK